MTALRTIIVWSRRDSDHQSIGQEGKCDVGQQQGKVPGGIALWKPGDPKEDAGRRAAAIADIIVA